MNWNKSNRILKNVFFIIAIITMPLWLSEIVCEPYMESRCEDDR